MLILASKSPRRKELLEQSQIPFIIDTIETDETFDKTKSIEDSLLKVSLNKALPIKEKHPNDTILSADTIVLVDGIIFGKPKDRNESIYMLDKLQGNVHEVLTGVTIIKGNNTTQFIERTKVYFKKMTIDDINYYIDHFKVSDKAGSYAIQEGAIQYIEKIEGSYSNVVGLPIEKVLEYIK